jgi:predicted SprT family Zn-dependent metalloprotease
MKQSSPTQKTYNSLTSAYDFFNERLFRGILPLCLITMQRKNRAYGYFAGSRFQEHDSKAITDEIALNPSHFHQRSTEQSLSTMVHEMVHLWQHHYGKPSRTGYHNIEWASMMRAVGLIPSATGEPGGKETGQNMTHYIEQGGAFSRACDQLMQSGFVLPYIEIWGDAVAKTRKKKADSKTKYTCCGCGLNAWAKPDVSLVCGECELLLEEEAAA